jgi:phospholipid transport system substrate-binding protein
MRSGTVWRTTMARALVRSCRRELLAIAAGFVVLALSSAPTPGHAAAAGAEEVVRGLVQDIWATLRRADVDPDERVDQLALLLEGRTDIALISRLALGRHWNRLSEPARQDYQELFAAVVIRSMARRLNDYAGDAEAPLEERFRIVSSAPAGESDVLVRSKVFPSHRQPLSLDWRLRDTASGPVVIDLIVEGASMLVAQRSEFAAVIERGDLAGLLAELRARAKSST